MMEGFVEVTPILRAGVYALLYGGQVVYVGKASKNMMTRIEAHRSLASRKQYPGWLPIKAVRFDEVYVLPCRIEDLDRIERGMIDLYRPRYNIQLKPPTYAPATTPLEITAGSTVIGHLNFRPQPVFERRI